MCTRLEVSHAHFFATCIKVRLNRTGDAASMHSRIQFAGFHDPVLAAPPEAALPEEHALARLHKYDAPVCALRVALAAEMCHNAPPNSPPLQNSSQHDAHACLPPGIPQSWSSLQYVLSLQSQSGCALTVWLPAAVRQSWSTMTVLMDDRQGIVLKHVLVLLYLPQGVDYQVCDLGCEGSIRDCPVKNTPITFAYSRGRHAVQHARTADLRVCQKSHWGVNCWSSNVCCYAQFYHWPHIQQHCRVQGQSHTDLVKPTSCMPATAPGLAAVEYAVRALRASLASGKAGSGCSAYAATTIKEWCTAVA